MDSRTAAHALSQIAAYLELKGENTFKCRAYSGAARGLLGLSADDLAPLLRISLDVDHPFRSKLITRFGRR
jgi:hypothetical protein